MPVENMEEEGLARIPDLNIAQWIFTCKTNPVRIPSLQYNTMLVIPSQKQCPAVDIQFSLSLNNFKHLRQLGLKLFDQDDNETRGKFMAAVTEHNMAPLYTSVCKDLKWKADGNLVAKMEANNKEKLATLEAAIADATENLGESETREALLKKAEFLAQVFTEIRV